MELNPQIMEQRLRSRKLLGITVLAVSMMILLIITISSFIKPAEGANPSANNGGWTLVFEESFESGIGADWTVSDTNGATNGEYYWATTSNNQSAGSFSAWVAGGGTDGSALTAGTDDYPNYALSSMIHDPVDLSGQNSARLTFDYWTDTESTFDILVVSASTDGSNYTNLAVRDGSSSGWQSEEVNLDAYAGQSQVWIRFFFSSNSTTTAEGVYVDDIRLETASEFFSYFPIIIYTVPPYFYFDDFSDPGSGWPIIDNTHNPQDCFKWEYGDTETYKSDICDDRTDVKVSPLVKLPDGDYEIEVDGRFRESGGWWTSYGILFDAKDEPDPNKPDLGDYYMVWVLWEGSKKHKWKILKDVPGDQIDLTSWSILDGSDYNYSGSGTAWNTWKISRTDSQISVSVNGNHLRTVNESRPTSNYQELFGVFSATYETNRLKVAFDNYLITTDGNSSSATKSITGGTYVSQPFSPEMERMLPGQGEGVER
jgi:hypothetical protein